MPGPLAGLVVGAALTLANNIPGRTHFVPIEDDHEDDRPTRAEPVQEAVRRDQANERDRFDFDAGGAEDAARVELCHRKPGSVAAD